MDENLNDTISRQAVLKQISEWSRDEFLRVTNPLHHLNKRINSLLPIALQESGWIPISESLPNLNDYTGSRVWQKKY